MRMPTPSANRPVSWTARDLVERRVHNTEVVAVIQTPDLEQHHDHSRTGEPGSPARRRPNPVRSASSASETAATSATPSSRHGWNRAKRRHRHADSSIASAPCRLRSVVRPGAADTWGRGPLADRLALLGDRWCRWRLGDIGLDRRTGPSKFFAADGGVGSLGVQKADRWPCLEALSRRNRPVRCRQVSAGCAPTGRAPSLTISAPEKRSHSSHRNLIAHGLSNLNSAPCARARGSSPRVARSLALSAALAWPSVSSPVASGGRRALRRFAACANPVACENQLPGDPPTTGRSWGRRPVDPGLSRRR